MKYIIADTDLQNCIELKKILDDYEILEFRGSYSTFSAAENYCLQHPTDIAFIFMEKTGMNAFRLARELKEINPFIKVIFISSQKENAVEAFAYEADGFLLIPFNMEKIDLFLLKWLEK